MGSRTIVGVVASLALLAPAAAAAATTTSPEDARPVAEQFVRALVASDGATACSLLSTRLQQRLGESCVEAFSSDQSEEDDAAAGASLLEAYVAALGSLTSKGRFPTPAKALKAELADAVDEVTFVIGTGPGVVRNREHTVVGIDRVRSNATRVVFYAESDSGTIFRLTGGLRGSPSIAKAAKGVPAPVDPLPEFLLASVAFGDAATAYVVVTVSAEGVSEDILLRLALEGEAWRVDEIFLPISELLGDVPL